MGQGLSLYCGSGSRQVFQAATTGETQALQEVLIARPDLLEATASGGQNVVHLAAARGDKEVLRAIVDAFKQATVITDGSAHDLKLQTMRDVHGSRQLRSALNLRTNAGHTPLMLAAKNGHVQCVKFLIDSGADVFKIDKSHQRSVLHYAVSAGQDGVLRYLVGENTLMHSEDGVQALRNIQVKDISGQCRYLDSRAENGLTALHIAAARGDLKCVKLLLEAGASMMVRTVDMDMPSQHSVPNGSTPLHLAAQKGNVAIVQVMLQAHADALGTWHGEGSSNSNGRRGWEQSTRIDLRSVANAMRQLPYHVAWQRGYRQTAQILNPTIAIDIALENVRELEEGFGPQKLSTLAAYCLRKNLLTWLEEHKAYLERTAREKEQRAIAKRVITEQKRKQALKFHSQESVDDSIRAENAKLVSMQDEGHTFSLSMDRSTADSQAVSKRDSKRDRKREAAIMDTIQSMNMNPTASGGARSQSLGDETASAFQAAAAQPMPNADVEDSASSAQTGSVQAEQNKKPLANMKRFASASRRFRNSMKKLRPTRPPPPPPPPEEASSSHDSLTIALPHHRRAISCEQVDQGGVTPEDDTPRAIASCLVSPFRSPFAQASNSLPPEEPEEREIPMSPQMTQHPSGVCLVNPPDVLPLSPTRQLSGRPPVSRLSTSKSRKNSLAKDTTLLGSFTTLKSRRSRISRVSSKALSRAASIPGFDNNMDSDDDCGICLEEPVNVAVAECSHKLCVDCAIKLCQTAKKPPLCPFCRITINAFQQNTYF